MKTTDHLATLLLLALVPSTLVSAQDASPSPEPSPASESEEEGWGARMWSGVQDLFDKSDDATVKLMARGNEELAPVAPKDTAVGASAVEFQWVSNNPIYKPKHVRVVVFEDGKFLESFETDGAATSFKPEAGALTLEAGKKYHWILEGQETPVVPGGSVSQPTAFEVQAETK